MHNNVDYIGQPVDLIEARFARFNAFFFLLLLRSFSFDAFRLHPPDCAGIKQYLNL